MNIQQSIGSYFGVENVTRLDRQQDLFRCVKKTESGVSYEIVYVDISDRWVDDEYGKRLETVLIDDYYENAGYLQWNFYYYFIADQDTITKYQEKKKIVENNEAYSRKFVLTEEQFEGLLNSLRQIRPITTDQFTDDLYSKWIAFLREQALYFVYNEKEYPNYVQWVEGFINGDLFNDISESPEPGSNIKEPTITRIKELDLHGFRNQPEKNNFIFGLVNLIHGPNAVGKTSLFDSLELIITGECKGSYGQQYSLEFIDIAGTKFKYPDENYKYKQRDIFWYKSAMTRGHNLNGNFNKFNYYASDAAFLLKMSDDSSNNNLEEIISDIALGREVNRLEERINEFKKRFETASVNFRNEEERLRNDLAEKSERLLALKKEFKDPESYKAALIDKLKELEWKDISVSNPDEFLISLENSIQIVSDNLSLILAKSQGIKTPTIKMARTEILSLNELLNKIHTQREIIANAKKELETLEKQISDVKFINEKIGEYRIYFNHPHFSSLRGLTERMVELEKEVTKRKSLDEKYLEISGISYLSTESRQSKLLVELENEIKKSSEGFSLQLQDIKQQIEQLEQGLNELSRIISSIKSQGLTLIQLQPDIENCPLCSTPFPQGELAQAIGKGKDMIANSDAVIRLKQKEENISKSIADNQKILDNLNRVKAFAILLYGDEWNSKTYSDIIQDMANILREKDELSDDLTKATAIQFQLVRDNISEDGLKTLEKALSTSVTFPLESVTQMDENENKLKVSAVALETSKSNQNNRIKVAEEAIVNLFNSELPDEGFINRQVLTWKEIKDSFEQILTHLQFKEDDEALNIRARLLEANSFFETYKKAFNNAKDHNQTTQYIETESAAILSQLDVISPKKTNADFAYQALSKLQREQNKGDYLKDYIEKNKQDISAIFRLIHSPNEFREIKLENNKINLIPFTGEPRDLNKISTGQRTALAVSIFLSLNKKLSKGPDIIFFDDPVTYVDDLNTLSFLDYLRQIVLQTKRQLFFSTANNDLAFLFKKKFEFLGQEEFKDIPLERTI